MNQNTQLQVALYKHTSYPGEIQVLLGINGATHRQKDGVWEEICRHTLPGNPHTYLEEFFGEQSTIKTLILEPPYKPDKPYVGTSLDRGLQFSILSSVQKELTDKIAQLSRR